MSPITLVILGKSKDKRIRKERRIRTCFIEGTCIKRILVVRKKIGTTCCMAPISAKESLSRAVVHESEKINEIPAYPVKNVKFSRIQAEVL